MNEQIRAPQLRVVRDDQQLGIMTRDEALRFADEANLDLVEIAPTASPPVARIMDHGKFKYEQAKRDRESRKGSKQASLREVRMRVKIDTHDIDFKSRTARKLLAEGDKVKVSVMFRAREITHPEVGRDLLDRFFERIRDVSSIERPPSMEGRMMSMIISPGVKRERPPQEAPTARQEPAAEAAVAETAVAEEPVAEAAAVDAPVAKEPVAETAAVDAPGESPAEPAPEPAPTA